MTGENDKFEFYKSKENHHWRRKARNGEIVGRSSEGYKNWKDCWENACRNGFCPEEVTSEGGHEYKRLEEED